MIHGTGPPRGDAGGGAELVSVMGARSLPAQRGTQILRALRFGYAGQCVAVRYERTLIHDPSAPMPSPTTNSSSESVVRNCVLTAVGIWNTVTMAGWIGSHTAATRTIVTSAPISPHRIPSRMNGQRMNESEAPTRRMISISPARL